MHPKSFKPVLPHESTISTYMRYTFAVLSKFACATSNFQNKLLFCVFVSLAERWGVANIFHARCILTMSIYSLVIAWEYDKGIRDAQSRNAKTNEFTLCCQIINSLESVGMEGIRGYGWPWKVKVMVEKGINFIFCLGTAYGISSMESVGNSMSFSLVGWIHLPKCFYL